MPSPSVEPRNTSAQSVAAFIRPRPALLIVVCLLVGLQVLVLTPASLESGDQTAPGAYKSIESLVRAQTLKDEVGYTIDSFRYNSVEAGIRNWEMIADQAVLYEHAQLVHATNARIKMFDADGKVTLIEGDHAYYKMGIKDLEMVGNVKVTFPDGFWLTTSKAKYLAAVERIESDEECHGQTVSSQGDNLRVWGKGFEGYKSNPIITIRNSSRVEIRKPKTGEITTVNSDKSRIDRETRLALFFMDKPERFVESKQGTLKVRSRRQRAVYEAKTSSVNYMVAEADVLIEETDPQKRETGLQKATSQKAEFLAEKDIVLLTGFPAAYQKFDTLTGEIIRVFRKTSIIEVEQANAVHEGEAE